LVSRITALIRTGVALSRLASVLVLLSLFFGAYGPAFAGQDGIYTYRLGPGDRLKITVFGHEKESGVFEIDGAGNVAFPLLGRIAAVGLTMTVLQRRLAEALDRSYIVNPRVTVEVLSYRPFYIYGEVGKSGSYPYVAGLTVRRAVAIAGGFSRRARHTPVKVVREAKSGVREMTARLDDPVLPGDVIEIARRLF
jgi:protein involved in polysaccharide export with SLBB domain